MSSPYFDGNKGVDRGDPGFPEAPPLAKICHTAKMVEGKSQTCGGTISMEGDTPTCERCGEEKSHLKNAKKET